MAEMYAGVYLLNVPYAIDHVYDYSIPRYLCDMIHRGCFVTLPFGNANRSSLAIVTEVRDHSDQPRHKPIFSVCSERLTLSEQLLGLCFFMKEQTLCTIGEAVRAMVPAAVLGHMTEVYTANADLTAPAADTYHPEDDDVLAYLRAGTVPVTTAALRRKFGSRTDESLLRLRRRHLILRDARYDGVDRTTYTTYYSLTLSREQVTLLAAGTSLPGVAPLRTAKQRAVLKCLAEQGEMTDRALLAAADCTDAVLSRLAERGLIVSRKQADIRRPYAPADLPPPPPLFLNEQQQDAVSELCAMADENAPRAALLYGVTGSGKTSVMMALITHLLARGKGAIVLLPEIALTPQSIALFCARFGETVAVIHSALSAGERYDAYRRIREGEARVVLGTRSAVFAPMQNPGAIIIDEEQEHTYKSDSDPKYHARDIARYRCAEENALMLLASATPSLESYYKATQGSYKLLKLTRRYGKAELPQVVIADMRRDAAGIGDSPMGTLLCEELTQNAADGNQSILFLNRRGYHHYVACRKCGVAISCPNCSVAMTYHTKRGSYTEGDMVCHFCGTRRPLPAACPECGHEHLTRQGYGTQRVEEELTHLLPSSRILRMDTDTTTTKSSYDEMLTSFRAGESDILLGTQMVTKGHDFPRVTLVGVLMADSSLYLDDYRAGERTFSMLTQVIGRAGRQAARGKAIIQTNNPDHDIIRLACAQDYEGFFNREIRLRRMLVFPPFCDIALLTLSGKDEKELFLAAGKLRDELSRLLGGEYADVQVQIFGPFEAPVYRVDRKYRLRMVIKCRLNKRSRAMFASLLTSFGASGASGTLLSIDFNPSSL
ncbi:MAG: primosomal protein N' [Clostridia bacterium]|nr:primosomal protein N' [Clostridia bacterium]